MISVACSGFPVPVSRYFREFLAVEISDTEIAIPGGGTVRRWIREAPEGFVFTALAPAAIGESGFKATDDNAAHLASIAELAEQVGARAVVFRAPEGLKPTKARRAALSAFAAKATKKVPLAVFDLPAWKPKDVLDAVGSRKKKVTVAYDPLSETPPPFRVLSYLRLQGPAGHRSRYDPSAVDEVAEHIRSLGDDPEVICVFRNIDMTTNAKQLAKAL